MDKQQSYKKGFIDHEPSKGTSLDEMRKQSKQKNADKRFNSPFAFHEPKYKKVNLMNRYPRAFVILTSGTMIGLFYR